MIIIRVQNGKETTNVFCDKCGHGYEWDHIVSKTRVQDVMRIKGWRIGKMHICEKCREKLSERKG